ncbi:MAG: AMP-binding protein, partial [Thermoanaerobaculia bacterium]
AEGPRLALRLVIFGGEALDFPTLAPWHARHGDHDPQLVNMYGITETTVHVTYRPLEEADLARARGSVLGRAILDLAVYVLDPRTLRPQPIGVPGEMLVGGAGVARGYLDRPALTAQRFIPDPFGSPGARLYRSGDLARWRPDGELEYLGRIDHQVKIRGFRIELGEIEAALVSHPAVREALVLARDGNGSGERRLVAWVVAPGGGPGVSELRRHLAATLPEHMVPSAIVFLDALPLTPNGKVDRKALPEPEKDRPELLSEMVAPRNGLEQLLAEMWREALQIDTLGIHDGFFELGGNSILGATLIHRIQKRLGVPVHVAAIFQAPTVAELAFLLAERYPEVLAASSALPPIERVERQPGTPLPLSSAQERLWLLDRIQPESPAYNMPAAVRGLGTLNVAAFRAALTEIVRRHEALRTTFAERDGQPVQVVTPVPDPRACSLPMIDLSGLPPAGPCGREAEVRRLAEAEALRPAWEDLLSRSSCDVPFLSPQWLLPWWKTFGG